MKTGRTHVKYQFSNVFYSDYDDETAEDWEDGIDPRTRSTSVYDGNFGKDDESSEDEGADDKQVAADKAPAKANCAVIASTDKNKATSQSSVGANDPDNTMSRSTSKSSENSWVLLHGGDTYNSLFDDSLLEETPSQNASLACDSESSIPQSRIALLRGCGVVLPPDSGYNSAVGSFSKADAPTRPKV